MLYIMLGSFLLLLTVALIRKRYEDFPVNGMNTDYGIVEQEHVFKELCKWGNPEIIYLPQEKMTIGKKQDLASFFLAKDADGNVIPVEVTDICKETGEPCDYPFTTEGIYQITVKAEDSRRCCTQKVFHIPVNRGE